MAVVAIIRLIITKQQLKNKTHYMYTIQYNIQLLFVYIIIIINFRTSFHLRKFLVRVIVVRMGACIYVRI